MVKARAIPVVDFEYPKSFLSDTEAKRFGRQRVFVFVTEGMGAAYAVRATRRPCSCTFGDASGTNTRPPSPRCWVCRGTGDIRYELWAWITQGAMPKTAKQKRAWLPRLLAESSNREVLQLAALRDLDRESGSKRFSSSRWIYSVRFRPSTLDILFADFERKLERAERGKAR